MMKIFNLIMQSPLLQAICKWSGIALMASLFVAYIRKDAANDKEKEIQLDEADETIKLIKEAKEAHEANNNISDDELAKRLS